MVPLFKFHSLQASEGWKDQMRPPLLRIGSSRVGEEYDTAGCSATSKCQGNRTALRSSQDARNVNNSLIRFSLCAATRGRHCNYTHILILCIHCISLSLLTAICHMSFHQGPCLSRPISCSGGPVPIRRVILQSEKAIWAIEIS